MSRSARHPRLEACTHVCGHQARRERHAGGPELLVWGRALRTLSFRQPLSLPLHSASPGPLLERAGSLRSHRVAAWGTGDFCCRLSASEYAMEGRVLQARTDALV